MKCCERGRWTKPQFMCFKCLEGTVSVGISLRVRFHSPISQTDAILHKILKDGNIFLSNATDCQLTFDNNHKINTFWTGDIK
jgi:hypothetical protein